MTPAIKETSECLVCNKPLGHDSKNEGFLTCHEHRVCDTCGCELSALDIKLCLKKSSDTSAEIELKHARCSVRYNDSEAITTIKQSDLDTLNLARLAFIPDDNLLKSVNEMNSFIHCDRWIEGWSHDKIYNYVGMLEAHVAKCRLLLRNDKEELKKRNEEREIHAVKRALQEQKTSSRPVGIKENDPRELEVASFMERCVVKERGSVLKLMKQRAKTIENFTKNYIKLEVAIKMTDDILVNNGSLVK